MTKAKKFLKFSNDQMTHSLFVSDHESRRMHKVDWRGLNKKREILSEWKETEKRLLRIKINKFKKRKNWIPKKKFQGMFMVFITPLWWRHNRPIYSVKTNKIRSEFILETECFLIEKGKYKLYTFQSLGPGSSIFRVSSEIFWHFMQIGYSCIGYFL